MNWPEILLFHDHGTGLVGAVHDSDSRQQNLPLPPADAAAHGRADSQQPRHAQLAKNALLLTLAAPSPAGGRQAWDDFAELALLFNIQRSELPATAKAADTLRAQNDQLVAQAYGITEPELAHLLASFKVMAAKRPEYVALLRNA